MGYDWGLSRRGAKTPPYGSFSGKHGELLLCFTSTWLSSRWFPLRRLVVHGVHWVPYGPIIFKPKHVCFFHSTCHRFSQLFVNYLWYCVYLIVQWWIVCCRVFWRLTSKQDGNSVYLGCEHQVCKVLTHAQIHFECYSFTTSLFVFHISIVLYFDMYVYIIYIHMYTRCHQVSCCWSRLRFSFSRTASQTQVRSLQVD